jgi:hypothetical protein
MNIALERLGHSNSAENGPFLSRFRAAFQQSRWCPISVQTAITVDFSQLNFLNSDLFHRLFHISCSPARNKALS